MSDKKLTILGILAAVMIILALVQSHRSSSPKVQSDSPHYLIQGLDPGDIGSIVLGKAPDTFTLKRIQKGFVVANNDNYPAVVSKINGIITSCLDIRTVELYTDDAANHKDLGVTEEDAQNVVKFLKPDSSLLAGIVIGKSKEQGQGCFVRLISSDEVYVTYQRPWVSERPIEYIDQELVSVNRDDIESVTVSGPNDVYTLKTQKDGGDIILENLPAGKQLKDSDAKEVFTVLTSLRFDDVKKLSTEEGLVFKRQFVCRLKDSTVYTIKIAQKEYKSYITCKAAFTDKTPVTKEASVESEEELKKKEAKLLARDKAKDFSARHGGWLYEIPIYKAKELTKELAELIKDEQSSQESEQTVDANSNQEEQQ